MSERYGKLFSLEENLYTEGSPVIIAAGALLKDNQTGKIIAQLKIQNIVPKKIKAATVCIQPLDTVGNPLGDTVTYQYLDLCADRDSEFGQKTPIALPNAATRSFQAFVIEVIFVDNTTWTQEIHPWESLKRVQTLSVLRDIELEKQFRMDYGWNCANLLLEQKDLWHCVCGAVNRQGETSCHKCRKAFADLKAIDMDSLRARKAERVAKEQEHSRAVQAQQAVESAKKKKIAKIGGIVVAFVIIVIIAVTTISSNAQKSNNYDHAMAFLNNGHYEEAVQILEELGNYKDSRQQLNLAKSALENEEKYNKALQALENGQEELAYQLFQELGAYKDAELYQYEFYLTNKTYTYEGSDYTVEEETKYQYDTQGRLIRSVYYSTPTSDGVTTNYSYDSDGNMSSIEEYYWVFSSSNRTPKKDSPKTEICEYNEHGDVIKRVIMYDKIQSDGTRHTEQTSEDIYTYQYNDDGTIASELCENTTTYGISGKTTTTYAESTKTHEYVYDENGRILSRKDVCTGTFGGTFTFVYSYDSFGNVISMTAGEITYTYTYSKKLVKADLE